MGVMEFLSTTVNPTKWPWHVSLSEVEDFLCKEKKGQSRKSVGKGEWSVITVPDEFLVIRAMMAMMIATTMIVRGLFGRFHSFSNRFRIISLII